MRPSYSAALRALLEDVVQSSAQQRTGARPAPGPGHLWRTAGITGVVAAGVIGVTVVVLRAPFAPDTLPIGPATTPTAISSPSSSPSTSSLVYLGLVSWVRPEASGNPTSTIYISEDWGPFRSEPGTCGIALATPAATISPSGTVTITVRGYGYRVAPGAQCTLERIDFGPVAVHLGRSVDVHAVTDGATHASRPLGIARDPGSIRMVHATPTPDVNAGKHLTPSP